MQIRIGIHTGEPVPHEGLYTGLDVHLAARIMNAGHGGQVLISERTRAALGASNNLLLADLGEHRLKDFAAPVSIFQLGNASFPPLMSISNTNLPRPASSFVGRERELEEVLTHVQCGAHLVSLTGPGGSGKTRLALEAAASLVPQFRAGVFWVGLAAIREPALVVETVSQTLGAKNGLAEHIGERELLLLDNLEQVISAAAQLAELLRTCPNLTLLVTSRELLRVHGEVEYAVPPLAEHEAVTLFCERARLEPSAEIAELCTRLDSLPLAVELAAARTKVLSPAQILERLSQRLDLLKGGLDADPRQQTLRTTIEWSHELLSQDEQTLFRRLSVFAGGCTLDAAKEVAGADLDTLQSLVEKSLLRISNERYWMLETIREYAAGRLAESGELEESSMRHAAFVLKLGAEVEATFAADAERQRFQVEQDNFRAALAWTEQVGDIDLQLDLIGRTWPFWQYRGPWTEGLRWVESALARSEGQRSERRAKVLVAGSVFALWLGELDKTKKYAEESLEMTRHLGDSRGTAWPLVLLGLTVIELGDPDAAASLFEEAIAVAREAGEPGRRGHRHQQPGRHRPATRRLCPCDSTVRAVAGDRSRARTADSVALVTYNLAFSLHHTGRSDEAVADAKESLALAHEIENLITLGDALVLLAAIASRQGDAGAGARVLGAAQGLRDRSGEEIVGAEAELRETTAHELRMALGEKGHAEAFAEGRAMSVDEAVEFALRM